VPLYQLLAVIFTGSEDVTKRLVDFASRRTSFRRMEKDQSTSVLYNANCPVCNFEILHYAKYSGDNKLPIRFDDLNSDARVRWELDADTAARRLYVLHNGTLTSGIPAFLVLWAQMPKYRWLSKVVGLPGIKQIASTIYDYVLAPAIYRWHLRRLRKQSV
jgi:predicted DCC family thiol-disulfide oxidoreductase YuxK